MEAAAAPGFWTPRRRALQRRRASNGQGSQCFVLLSTAETRPPPPRGFENNLAESPPEAPNLHTIQAWSPGEWLLSTFPGVEEGVQISAATSTVDGQFS